MRVRLASFDALGALLVTGGMLLLVYALVKAPTVGWGATRTIAELTVAGLTLVAFVANELRVRQSAHPAVDPPRQGCRRRRRHAAGRRGGLRADVLLPHALHADRAALLADPDRHSRTCRSPAASSSPPASLRSSSRRIGTKPVIVVGAVIVAAGLYWLSRIPVDGSYV